ncbi:hypothetical protein ARMGADRAFT_1022606 [Armillaria gallica]|uniref:Uncharacterized protein n=1 Tax=Armillaria gallica TaxID=47427 RepID=A0A2H3E9L2_ARMGA|nr:hypothetical protein ARMGADRAFT_1022606 [Armillaria gallica]
MRHIRYQFQAAQRFAMTSRICNGDGYTNFKQGFNTKYLFGLVSFLQWMSSSILNMLESATEMDTLTSNKVSTRNTYLGSVLCCDILDPGYCDPLQVVSMPYHQHFHAHAYCRYGSERHGELGTFTSMLIEFDLSREGQVPVDGRTVVVGLLPADWSPTIAFNTLDDLEDMITHEFWKIQTVFGLGP